MRNIEEEAQEERRAVSLGTFIGRLGTGGGVEGLAEGVLTGFTVRMPTEEEPSALLVVKARTEAGKWVAFVGAYSLVDCMMAWRARERGAGLRWREDKPWGER